MEYLPKDLILKLNRTLVVEVSFTYDVTPDDRKKIEDNWKKITKGKTKKETEKLAEETLISHKIKVDGISFYRKPDKSDENIVGIQGGEYKILQEAINEIISQTVTENYWDYWG